MRIPTVAFAMAVTVATAPVACTAPAPPDAAREAQSASGDVPSALSPEVAWLTTPEQEALDLPFSDAVRVGSMLYLSGKVGNVPGTLELVEGGIQAETRQAMENIQASLERNGSSLERVVKCTVMIEDMAEWPAMNEVYAEFFPVHKPARSAVGADGLALGAAVEIECWAAVQ